MTRQEARVFADRLRDAVVEACGGETAGWCQATAEAVVLLVPGATTYHGGYDGTYDQAHTIARVGDWYIDVTADQFGGPAVVVTDRLAGKYADFAAERTCHPAAAARQIASLVS